MKKHLTALLAALMIATALVTFVACDRKGVHTVATEWSHDEINHWHKCTDCDDIVFDSEPHTLTNINGKKTCTKCGYSTDCTTEENFNCWVQGRNNVLLTADKYTTHYKNMYYIDGVLERGIVGTESRNGNNYFDKHTQYATHPQTNEQTPVSETVSAIKLVQDGDVTRTKFFHRNKLLVGDGQTNKQGSYVQPNYAEQLLNFVPSQNHYLKYFVQGATFTELTQYAKTV